MPLPLHDAPLRAPFPIGTMTFCVAAINRFVDQMLPVCETTTQSRFGAPRPPGKFPRGLAPRDLSGPLQWDPLVVSKS
jgi:hypothetical protein